MVRRLRRREKSTKPYHLEEGEVVTRFPKGNLQKDHCRTLETERPENDETSLSVGRFLTVPADSVVMRSSLAKTSVLVGSYA